MNGVYEIVGSGKTEAGRAFVFSGISGYDKSTRSRFPEISGTVVSLGSMPRLKNYRPSKGEMVFDPPSGELLYDPLKAYNPQMVTDILDLSQKEWDHNPFAVAGNGSQVLLVCDAMMNYISVEEGPIKRDLKDYGDKYDNPRLFSISCVNIISAEASVGVSGGYRNPRMLTILHEDLAKGEALTLSTLLDDSGKPYVPRSRVIRRAVEKIRLKGDSPSELAQMAFDLMCPETAVCANVAVWSDEINAWELATKSRYKLSQIIKGF